MSKTLLALATSALILGASVAPASADFHPLRTARAAADLGLDTARRAVDLGLDTAHDIVTPDTCRHGTRYKDAQGHWHTCRR
jgi:alkanesulfonate monooxygenase SsuD/methylene tetrahydromethanopterin reductase-like flavin-dependent oxidoreductase (luciferase family)